MLASPCKPQPSAWRCSRANRVPLKGGEDDEDLELGDDADDRWDWEDPEDVAGAAATDLVTSPRPPTPKQSGAVDTSLQRQPAAAAFGGTVASKPPARPVAANEEVDLLDAPAPEPAGADLFESLGMEARPSFNKKQGAQRPGGPPSTILAMDQSISSVGTPMRA